MRYTHKLAFVVPTYNRPEDLRRMLKSLSEQSVPCAQCIIVDASEEPVRNLLEEFPGLPLDYVHVSTPSLSQQRNAGMQKLRQDITLAGYLDDDIVLLDGALEAMLSFWESASQEVGGARFNIEDDYVHPPKWWQSVFLIKRGETGMVLRSGFYNDVGTVSEDIYVQILSGGATIWRREVISEFDYDEWYAGHGYLEDLDYSYRVSKKYRLVVLVNARVLHLTHPLRKDRNYLLGQWQVINRLYFVKKHPELSVLLCYWAIFGNFLINVAGGLLHPNSGRLSRAWGNCVGLAKALTGQRESLSGLFK